MVTKIKIWLLKLLNQIVYWAGCLVIVVIWTSIILSMIAWMLLPAALLIGLFKLLI